MVRPITDPERLEKAWKQAKASAEIEGHVFTPEDEKVIKAVASGKMTREALIENLKKG